MQNKTLQLKRALRAALLVLLLSVAGMGKGYAQSFTVGNLRYYRGTDTASVSVSGHKDGTSAIGSVVIPESVVYQGNSYLVTRISDNAFKDCSGLTSVTIPNSVIYIGYSAFSGCSSLTSITIPDSVTSIANSTFSGCSGLLSVTIGNFVTSISQWAFADCSGLTSITIPNSVTSIGRQAFYRCSGLLSVTIGSSVTSIGANAFSQRECPCSSLRQIIWNAKNITTCPTDVTNRPFYGCLSLETIVYSDSVQRIPKSVFYIAGGGHLTSVTISNSVTSIGESAFSGFTSIDTIYFSGTLSQWCGIDFENPSSNPCFASHNYISINGTQLTTNLDIPSDVTEIKRHAFYGCSEITSITIPQLVTSIGSDAFGKCSRLTTVYYNAENAEGSPAFSNCENLTTLHIGTDVREIHPVFGSCSSVHLVVALGSTPAVLESNALTDIAENSVLMVPCGNKLNYFSVWNMFDFNNIMEDCGEYSINLNNIGTGGNVSASTTQAQMGQEVQLTVTPNAGMVLSSLTVCNASDPTQTFPVYHIGKGNKFGFIMPPYGVSVNATFVAGTSVEENDNVPVSVYPNPTKGNVTIEAEDLEHITISNLLGQTIFDGNAIGNIFEYDFSKHKTGIYLIRIEIANGMAVKKVSVTR